MKTLLVTFVSCLMLTPAVAERTVRLIYFGAPATSKLKTVYLYSNDQEKQPGPISVDLKRRYFTKQIGISNATTQIRISDRVIAGDEEISSIRHFTHIPKDWEHTLLICLHSNDSKPLPFRIKKVNASNDRMRPGDYHWINFSNLRVAGTVGDVILRLAPGKEKLMKRPAKGEQFAVKLKFLAKGQEKPETLVRQMWRVSKTMKQIVFIYGEPPPGYVTFYVIPLPEKKAPKKNGKPD